MHKNLSVGDQITLEENIEGVSVQFYRGDTVKIIALARDAALVEIGWRRQWHQGKLQDWILVSEEGELVGR